MATVTENEKLVEYLLKHKADVALQTKEGTNVFHMACYFNKRSLNTLKFLIADAEKRNILESVLNAIDNHGETPLVRACLQLNETSNEGKHPTFQLELIKFLKEYGATRFSDY